MRHSNESHEKFQNVLPAFFVKENPLNAEPVRLWPSIPFLHAQKLCPTHEAKYPDCRGPLSWTTSRTIRWCIQSPFSSNNSAGQRASVNRNTIDPRYNKVAKRSCKPNHSPRSPWHDRHLVWFRLKLFPHIRVSSV
jgi:hypothetical protein